MAHLFISYSRKDIDYVRKVVDSLLERGFDVWFDAQIEYGQNWESAIFAAIDEAAAVVVIMTPDAAASAWVPREIAYAENRGKPIFPLLLSGEVFPRLILTQFANVRDGLLPDAEYYAAIAKVLLPRSGRGQEIQIAQASVHGFERAPAHKASGVQERKLESAMPRQSARGVPTEVRVKISKLDTLGLRGELPDFTEYGDEIKKDDVRAATFPMEFPRDADGSLQPVNACIQVESDQYSVQYPRNACGDGAAEVQIHPDHDTRTIIFTLLPMNSAYTGRAAVTVRLLHNGSVIAENMVTTRIIESVTEQTFVLATAAIAPVPGAISAPTRPIVAVSKTIEASAPTVPIHIDKRLTTAPPPAAPSTTTGQQPMMQPIAPPRPAARKRGGGMMRYGGLLGILLAGIVGVLVMAQGRGPALLSAPTTVASLQSTTTSPALRATEAPVPANKIRARIGTSGETSDTSLEAWVGDPVSGLTRVDALDIGTEVSVLSKAEIRDDWYLEMQSDDGYTFWMHASDVTLASGATLDDVGEWEA